MEAGGSAGVRLEFSRDVNDFLRVAGEHLAADPVVSTIITTIAHRVAAEVAGGITAPDRDWWLTGLDEAGAVVGAGMRTAPFEPYPAFLLSMPDAAALAVAHAVHDRGEELRAINGALPTVEVVAGELARLGGGRVEVAQHTRLHELGELVQPPPVPGQLVVATVDDVDLATDWFGAFMGDADEQAGRVRGASAHGVPDRDEMLARIRSGRIWFWHDDTREPVHVISANPPAFGVARVGPVYTPPEQRGHGWASNAVFELSGRLQSAGARVCLFTDQANPTPNRIYAALGYRPVVDMANLVIVG